MKNNTLYQEIKPSDMDLTTVRPWIRQRQEGEEPSPNLVLLDDDIVFDLAVWVAQASPHPITPAMTTDEFASLKASIREHGLLEGEIVMNEVGEVIDGYHRTRAIYELRLEGHAIPMLPITIGRFLFASSERLMVALLNLTRRHMTLKQRREAAARLLKAGHDGTDNHVADLCGLSGDTVKTLREELESLPLEAGGIEKLPARKSKAGKTYRLKQSGDSSEAPASEDNDRLPHPVVPHPAVGVVDEVEEKASEPASPKNPAAFDKLLAEPDEIWAFLHALVSEWWHKQHFLPCYSVELYEMAKQAGLSVSILGKEGKQAFDNMTRLLSALEHRPVSQHLIYRRNDKNGTVIFSLSPPNWSPLKK